ncbi:hypothetical protein [Kitasatospora cheerisanensis]|uniref:Uncharacterized protein n=1 Tax=Kitasatospora cheerisanensis KCTC 2395 TaxID=1348663 RepID=A0A066Z5X7_9ACTN|nr:hypothetical protein [Kitasatospora cheerisanensis]KDN85711.1 hypothetical protein KCH_25390 [Kitasatospora cheerisanensis KCTC 2395]
MTIRDTAPTGRLTPVCVRPAANHWQLVTQPWPTPRPRTADTGPDLTGPTLDLPSSGSGRP